MDESETISEYMTKILSLTNQLRSCGEEIKEQTMVEKVFRTLTPKYDHIVVVIEEPKNLEDYKVEELQGSLEAHELREKSGQGSKISIKTQIVEGYGHFASECKVTKWSSGKEDEAGLAQEGKSNESNDDHCLLMATTRSNQDKAENVDFWYLDTGCSNPMTGIRDWFTTLDETTKNKVKFVNMSSVSVEGIGTMMIQRKDGRKSYISRVLYVPRMKNNLMSLG
ncbi:PREDICTED: uncharacterized protein LOC109344640 [Lupinus angustifolius]|uniref:uncharacterized protein LOC109344640 n=1 Tax=Lupinus angustifolius TaxID=3871 RepID=UPI00092FBD63|nr:PREDICTED: uncharacterized protein LOC109344640 [Lupinus angustifolius]